MGNVGLIMTPALKEMLKDVGRYVPNAIYWRVTPLLLKNAFGAVEQKPAKYFLDVWRRHYLIAQSNGLGVPAVVAEIGPGGAMGVGICALLAGAQSCIGLDEFEYGSSSINREIFNGLQSLADWSDVPAERLNAIDLAIQDQENPLGIKFKYETPMAAADVEPNSVDFLISHAVMEHVENIAETYRVCAEMLKPGGVMSHQIDFRCHGTANRWNGHWSYDDKAWRKISSGRPYLLNRAPHSTHMETMTNLPLEITWTEITTRLDGINRAALTEKFAHLSDDDLTTRGALIQAKRLP